MAQGALVPAETRHNGLVILDVLARFYSVGTLRGLQKSRVGVEGGGTTLVLTR